MRNHLFLIFFVIWYPVLSEPIESFRYLIFTESCFQDFFSDYNFKSHCFKLSLSKLLGYLVVLGAGIVKVPQIIKILKEKSVFGISFESVILELLMGWLTIIYNLFFDNPFSIYGDHILVLLQNFFIIGLFCAYSEKPIYQFLIPLLLLILFMITTAQLHLWSASLMGLTIYVRTAFGSSSRLTQIYEIWKCKSTGSLSFATFLLFWLATIFRLYTVAIEVSNDLTLLYTTAFILVLNSLIILQFFKYRKSETK